MKKIKLAYLLGFGLLAGMFTSCAESIEPDNDGNPDGKYTVNYAVQVVAVGDVTRGLNGASVTIQTQNGVTTKSVGSDGIAVFENINAGTVSGYVSAPGYASVNFTANVLFNNVDVNSNGYVSSTVHIPAMNAGLAGRIYADWDQDGNVTLTDAGNFMAVDMKLKYTVGAAYPMGTGDGALTSVNLDYNTYTRTSSTSGDFLFDNMPNTDLGYFGATVKMDAVNLVSVAAPPAQVIWNWGPMGVSLLPGETQEWGDIYVP